MSLWFKETTLKDVQGLRKNTMADHIGIEFIGVTNDSLIARMPIDERTIQPFGIMHGGASCALAETVGSVAGCLTIDLTKKMVVGIDINTSHLKMVRQGWVTAEAKPVHVGGKIQVWQIKAQNDQGELVSLSRLTLMVIDKKEP